MVSALIDIRKEAEQGHAEAQFNLGLIYYNGEGVQRDDAEAVKWFLEAAEQGHVEAQFNLGLMYYNGDGVPPDYVEAVKWYLEAAKRGHAEAKFNLELMFCNDEIAQDDADTVFLFLSEAKQGEVDDL